MLTALCVALPAQAGLMVIGGEGALVLGGLAAAVAGHQLAVAGAAPLVVKIAMAVGGHADRGGCGSRWPARLRQYRGVNETISSLLLTYIAIALFNHLVEGPLRDPASLNKPSTTPIGDANMLGHCPASTCTGASASASSSAWRSTSLVRHTTFGFALRIVGGNARAARLVGLPVGR